MDLAAEPLLRLDRVSKAFATSSGSMRYAVQEVTLELGEREFVSLIGPSGCGKSTLLRLAAGLLLPTSGLVAFRGEPVTAPDRRRGVVFQSYNSFPWLTVAQNVAFGLDGMQRAVREERVHEWLTATELLDFADAYPKMLSGGMQQRLALARTMVVEPELLLLDEPFGALDEPTRRAMQRALVATVEKVSCAVVFVTHDIREAAMLSDRVVLMSAHPGRLFRVYDLRNETSDARLTSIYEQIVSDFPHARQ